MLFYFICSWPFLEVDLTVILWMPSRIRASSTITSAGSSTWAGRTRLRARVPTTAANAWPTSARTRRRCSTRAGGRWTRRQCRVTVRCQEGPGLQATLNTVSFRLRAPSDYTPSLVKTRPVLDRFHDSSKYVLVFSIWCAQICLTLNTKS